MEFVRVVRDSSMKLSRTASIAKYSPRRDPKQRRSRVVVQRIQAAAQSVLLREGAEALTTNRIAEVANLSVGSIYQYFPNKSAIVTVLVNAFVDSVELDVLGQLAASAEIENPQARGRRVIHQFIRSLVGRADEVRALWPFLEELQRLGLVRRPENVIIDAVRRMDRNHNIKLRHRNGQAAIEIAVDSLSRLVNAYLLHRKPNLPPEEFSDLVADLVVRFLYEDDR
jgi:AcrR family transcriptional regulator